MSIIILKGKEALQTIEACAGLEIATQCVENHGKDGWWVEISKDATCAGWSYNTKLEDSFLDAYKSLLNQEKECQLNWIKKSIKLLKEF